VRFLAVNDLDDRFGHPVTQYEDQGLYLIGLREEPLENPFNRATKRLLDIAISLPVVVFILPILTAIVWLCQRVQSSGPIFYLQARPGSHNRPFNILKYRTLHVDNPDVNRLPAAGDRRLYPAGRLMRKRSLDELPQFLNVLRGDMSVVGPRPHLWAHNDLFPTIFNKAYVRSFVKPGITGLAQVRGLRGQMRCEEDVVRRMQADIHYLENWSFWLDCWLILRTALQLVFPLRTAV
jgi:lipopolysaccharide/colanic/teichoic acid biosynthesis glycosyltransferase